MIDIKKLENFTEEMKKVLDEKVIKYGDTDSWKTTAVGKLRDSMNRQLEDISSIIVEKIDWDHELVKRKLIHVANYCFFIYDNIKDMDNKFLL